MIRYTDNPYVDAGAAVLELRLHKPCAEFTEDDLVSQADWIRKEYRKKIWKSYLMLHLPNCAWTQADPDSEKNRDYVRKVLESYKPDYPALDRRCAFCDGPAKVLADRRYVPLLTGETSMVAGAQGQPGLPVCGYCVFAVHFYPLTTLKVDGRPLFWWAPHPNWARRLNRTFYNEVQKLLVASADELPKLRWPATRLLHAARQAIEEIEKLSEPERPPLCDIVGIHATNFGTAASYDELHISAGLLEFWTQAGAFGDLYRRIEQQAWETEETKPEKKRRGKEPHAEPELSPVIREASRRNLLYEALGRAFRAPHFREEAKRVAVRFFMPRRGKEVGPNTTALAELFLEKVAGMERTRLEAIRQIADAIVESRHVKWILDKLMRSGRSLYDYLPVVRAVQQRLSSEQKPIPWDRVLLALNLSSDEDSTARDTWLVSELILVRIFERLGQAHSEVLAEITVPEEIPQATEATT
jgi:CRISPR-associated protein Cst1